MQNNRLLAFIYRRLFAAETLPRAFGIYEPMTTLTDYLLTLLALVFARSLWQSAPRSGGIARRWWAIAFVASALAAFTGGTFHGFAPRLPASAKAILWKLTMIGTGLTSFCMLMGTLYASASGRWRLFGALLIAAKSGIYLHWLSRENDFKFVIYDYASAMLAVLLVQLRGYRTQAPARYITQGIGISVLAAAAQQIGINLHTHFNKNDLYHVIQALGLFALYRGAGGLSDHTGTK
jgi:hypothetical protein